MENFSLVKVKWSEHRERLKPIIDEIGLKANDPELYTNINKACSNEWAFLFLANEGFTVLRPRFQNNINYIEVSVAYCTSGDVVNHFVPLVHHLAKKVDAQFIEFLSVRKGFRKLAMRAGLTYHGQHQHFAIWRYHL